MKFTCAKNKLQEAISIAQKAVTGKSPMPILQGIHLSAKNNELTLIGSDIDLSIETKIEAEVQEEGSIVVDSKIFGEIIRKLPNSSIHINTTENNSIEIVCEKSKFDLIHMDAEEFPNLPSINENIIFSIPEKVLKNMIKGTIFAIAQDETRPILTGILFEVRDKRLNLVALDGYRLALRSNLIDNENTISAVIPGKTFNEVSKILSEDEKNVNITFTPNHILFNLGETKIISRLLEGEFIKYNSIIPEEYKLKVNAKRAELLNCIERASLMGKDGNTNLVKFDIKNDNLVITSNSQLGRVREELNIILQGDELQIAFNSKYLIDVLKILEDDEIVMEFDSSVSPCVIKSKENNTYTYLVLPVRLLNA
ncbi:DNA polymerase III subunit beta [Clostridium botulinum]|uniref:Beta sliding clamp n=1 Tax=Clostridium botulinum TaxID=1491 RepID=A0A9Q1UXQ6_CLOBO|nr:DNA polymerase III subunit beta [Clostridium botulinum]AEB77200.1 DNA polymerase III, beta subunit [Clostridium botulinum BKT015925]KEI01709.1 DNA polymerase III subunit beta [Clostridium botulinum C/D str. Sp77]KEI02716.1 DNA polymerase III subunit beta [Clostridium botulinum D str. 16868]KLU74919.1 DNA polymerase III subunit beta [Clostridium botulinum V891]KOA77088.1 DNA polymerase III subunit beta [Clostridium botulinum]